MNQLYKEYLKHTIIYYIYRNLKKRNILKKRKKEFYEWNNIDDSKMLFYSQFINTNDIVFDVGSNLGNRTKVFLKLGAKVISFDPQEECSALLCKISKKEKNLIHVSKGLGKEEKQAIMYISNNSTVSSLSSNWIKAVRSHNRFEGTNWDLRQAVDISTLDIEIMKHGKPKFCKIDVEGYELEVILGLCQPIDFISFEFTPEFINNALAVIDHLSSIGDVSFQFSLGESMKFSLDNWVRKNEIIKILKYDVDPMNFGDVYVKTI